MLQNKPNPNIPKGIFIVQETFPTKYGYPRYFSTKGLTVDEIINKISWYIPIQKSSFIGEPKEYMITTATESKIFSIY